MLEPQAVCPAAFRLAIKFLRHRRPSTRSSDVMPSPTLCLVRGNHSDNICARKVQLARARIANRPARPFAVASCVSFPLEAAGRGKKPPLPTLAHPWPTVITNVALQSVASPRSRQASSKWATYARKVPPAAKGWTKLAPHPPWGERGAGSQRREITPDV